MTEKNVSLEFKLVEPEKWKDLPRFFPVRTYTSPGFIGEFTATPVLSLNGRDIFETNGEGPKIEFIDWLYWLANEKPIYCSPSSYIPDAPENLWKMERQEEHQRLTEEQKRLKKWANGHVLMYYIGSAPYLAIQAPTKTKLEIYWNHDNPCYVHKTGKELIDQRDFFYELDREKSRIRAIIFGQIPALRRAPRFGSLL
jgi:hypothetical protein